MDSISALTEKATWNHLTQKEIDYVTERFYASKPGQDEDLGAYIYILGRIGAVQHKSLIEKYLYCPEDPDVAATALRVLCLYWNYTEEYLDQIVSFIKGVTWDDVDDVRLMSFSVLGKFLKKKKNPQLIHLLTDFVDDPTKIEGYVSNRNYAEAFLQACAYTELCKALGCSDDEIFDEEYIEILIQNNAKHELVMLEKSRQFLNAQNTC